MRIALAAAVIGLALPALAFAQGAPSAAAPAAPAAPAPIATPSLIGAGNRLLVGSLILAALLFVASRLVRRMPLGRLLPRSDGPIRMVSRTHLGPKASLCLIEVESTTLLVAIAGEHISALHT